MRARSRGGAGVCLHEREEGGVGDELDVLHPLQRGVHLVVGALHADGEPHPVLDALYDNIDLALADARLWCKGQGAGPGLQQRGIAIEVNTLNGDWRTIDYPLSCLVS